ncbi:NADH-quinone oxidoreductase subunit NuoN [Nocardia terpenica]|uniref:NADH-quinone oxidoreductase subunit NuoN n=1 Tax=Nocardia terpenica TaxID=455432 RepID=UPI001893BFC2|nr:NADH-quinone oxidoreductase subunit NuoN [Nocardia terpenica]MBF6061529.1 NADH-quinone oxidoreductase subunit NuoN [Nocardia terpenica]MBF6105242.1 NADH-quinone oxidoreductase subunit NuoN [Nocardia terpenica]MBF6113288.1 NADH-quinone oxidoreductase subunit NuoN [Nocardia terpenica]MBF6119418.1 NADH-quinone oxidoreductase subunit NuoN [Nocardia terpenica]MBF6153066.1 NADH-quinone oxidoreductase subunit NuoN [Nocardia terpenica]
MSHVLAASIPAPSIEYRYLMPMLIVFGAAVAGVLVEAFAPRPWRYYLQLVLGLGGLGVALGAVVGLTGTHATAVVDAVAVDNVTLFLQGVILVVAILGVLLMAERGIESRLTQPHREGPGTWSRAAAMAQGAVAVDAFTPQASAMPGSPDEIAAARAGITTTEVFPLTMFAVGGLLLFPASNDLLTMFVALEVLSLPLYLLCGLARRHRLLSQEAALKYFLLGAFSSAFFLYGMALLYGYAGTVRLSGIADAISRDSGSKTLAVLGVAMLAVGLLFKIGAVPFQSWVPDVYQGAPTAVTGFMAAATKIAAVGALLRLLQIGVPGLREDWRPILGAIAILTMAVGAIMAVTQTDVKRMLAYSSIAHAGFMMTALVAANETGVSAVLFYLAAYGLSTIGAFAVVTLVRDKTGGEATALSAWAGLGRRSPWLATIFALFLLSFAGIPLTSGFVSKFAVFEAAASGNAPALVIIGVICSAIAVFFYIRVIVLMFFTDPPEDGPTVVEPLTTTTVIAITAAATLVLGILPQPVLDMAHRASVFVH